MDSVGCFSSFCRTHSSGDHGNQEPWAFDEEVIDITRKFVNLRYHYYLIYTPCFGIEEGIPMLKPLVYYDQATLKHIIEMMSLYLEIKY
jgi:alpha-glucosidase